MAELRNKGANRAADMESDVTSTHLSWYLSESSYLNRCLFFFILSSVIGPRLPPGSSAGVSANPGSANRSCTLNMAQTSPKNGLIEPPCNYIQLPIHTLAVIVTDTATLRAKYTALPFLRL